MLPTLTLTAAAAAYGAAAGTLVPRAAYRLSVDPGKPWRRRCPAGHLLEGRVGGWLGPARCVRCRLPYGRGAAFHPAAGAVCCAALAAAVGWRPELIVWLLLTPVALLLAAVDWRVRRLPDVLTLPSAAVATMLLGAAAPARGAGGSWSAALLGGAVLAGTYFVLFLISPRGMGFGDVKLALAVGIVLGWYGWDAVLAGSFLGFLGAGLYGLALLLLGRAGRGSELPFGPFMLLGSLPAVLAAGLTV